LGDPFDHGPMGSIVRHVAQFLLGAALLAFCAFNAKVWSLTVLLVMLGIALCLLLGTEPIKLLDAVIRLFGAMRGVVNRERRKVKLESAAEAAKKE
jgi:hypothetical protein